MTSPNQSVVQSRQKLSDLPLETIKSLTECLLEELGNPPTQLEQEALRALQSGDYDSAKRFPPVNYPLVRQSERETTTVATVH